MQNTNPFEIINKALLVLEHNGQESIRFNTKWGYKRKDNSLFGLLSGLFIFQTVAPALAENEQGLILEIGKMISKISEHYKNPKGRNTYNFYPKGKHFANGFLMHRLKHFKLPDDIDDTALLYSCFAPESAVIEELSQNLSKFKHSTGLYNTWFGENMPEETDICAIINMLICMHKNQCWSTLENENLAFVLRSIKNVNEKSFSLSRHYGHAAIIFYHYGRLIEHIQRPEVQGLREVLIEEINKIKHQKLPEGFKILLSSTMFKLNQKGLEIRDYDFDKFYSYIGAPWAPVIGTNRFSASEWSTIYWKSNFYNLALSLEHLTVKKKYARNFMKSS